ncbi:MarR family transcriptional regulator [Roseomonas nepalensis]|uniref:MarR family transcriptional regulator n=1 Tax=Muricoccus nepalensis TaxID=1854500 RepID=A0A502F8N4_9PROT|nr:MarR family winged helix-turn-helix transcriptional regulator [Roseomonas nepalensis]TPG45756.1 MarR family transcriptional regulator [Roseomonas nepalensis]
MTYRLTDAFPYLLNKVGVRMGDLFARRLAQDDLTLPMYRVLAVLWEGRDRRLGELCEVTGIELSTLSRLVGTLSRRGLVRRRRPEGNARVVAINLTPAGRAMAERLIPFARHHEAIALRGLDAAGVTALRASLGLVHENLGALEREMDAEGVPPARGRAPR